jgi:hypothetical protein
MQSDLNLGLVVAAHIGIVVCLGAASRRLRPVSAVLLFAAVVVASVAANVAAQPPYGFASVAVRLVEGLLWYGAVYAALLALPFACGYIAAWSAARRVGAR